MIFFLKIKKSFVNIIGLGHSFTEHVYVFDFH